VAAQLPEMLVRPVVLMAVFLSAAWLGNGQVTIMHALYALIAAAVLSASAGQLLVRQNVPEDYLAASPRYETRTWIATSVPIAVSAGLLTLNASMGILALSLLADVAEVGRFRVAIQVSLVSGLAYTALNMIASQRFAYFRASDDHASMQIAATTMARIATVCALPIPIVLMLFGEQVVSFLFGSEFNTALPPMIILAAGQFVIAATGMAQPLLVMHGLEREVAKWTMLALIINIILCAALVPLYDGVGAALATLGAASVWKILLWKIARNRLQIDAGILGLLPR
jgi:O-antigen/teichoic acid export membrane protein